jgi:hypothetical protein
MKELITIEGFKTAEDNYYSQLEDQGYTDGKRLTNDVVSKYVNIINNAEEFSINGNWEIYDKDNNLVLDNISKIDNFLNGTGFLNIGNELYNRLNKI